MDRNQAGAELGASVGPDPGQVAYWATDAQGTVQGETSLALKHFHSPRVTSDLAPLIEFAQSLSRP
jgi:hypothetical protein